MLVGLIIFMVVVVSLIMYLTNSSSILYLAAAGYGGVGGECNFAVKHHEQHVCNSCDEVTIVSMKLSK